MQKAAAETCLTCYGTGEAAIGGTGLPETCPDCFGEGKALARSTKLEWRLRAIEKTYRTAEHEVSVDVLWLVNEVRQAREALLRILARCQDADDSNTTARDVKFQANDALGVYVPD